jgi:hypothetical protein
MLEPTAIRDQAARCMFRTQRPGAVDITPTVALEMVIYRFTMEIWKI